MEYGRQHGAQSGYGQGQSDQQLAEYNATQGSDQFRGPYKVEFTIKYETKLGENFRMIGSLPQLGEWDLQKSGKLTWTPGHYWKVTIESTEPFFFYKYVIVDNNCKALRWEEGENRIADVRVLCIEAKRKSQAIAHQLDKWDFFTIKYSIFHSLKEGEYMRINGDTEKLGNWNKEMRPIQMKLGDQRKNLDGVLEKPWEIEIEYSQKELMQLRTSDLKGMLTYKYSIRNRQSSTATLLPILGFPTTETQEIPFNKFGHSCSLLMLCSPKNYSFLNSWLFLQRHQTITKSIALAQLIQKELYQDRDSCLQLIPVLKNGAVAYSFSSQFVPTQSGMIQQIKLSGRESHQDTVIFRILIITKESWALMAHRNGQMWTGSSQLTG